MVSQPRLVRVGALPRRILLSGRPQRGSGLSL